MPPDAVLLLGDVRELEIGGEGAEDARLPFQRQRRDRRREIVGRTSFARGPREPSHALDVGEQRLVLLLHEYAPEQVAEQTHVAPERRVCCLVLSRHDPTIAANGLPD